MFAICIDIERRLSFHAQPRRLEVFHAADAKVPAEVNRWKQASQLERIDAANHANIKLPVIHSSARRDLHPAAVSGSVGKSCQDRGLIAASRPARAFVGSRNLHGERGETKNSWNQGQRITPVPTHPARQLVSPAGHFPIQPDASHAAEIMWRGRPARVTPEGQDDAQINRPQIAMSGAEPPPSRKRIAQTMQSQGASKIIPATNRHNQHRQSKLHQLTQVTMDGSVATKQQDDVIRIGSRRHPDAPVDLQIGLKGLEALQRTPQPENSRRSHLSRLRLTERPFGVRYAPCHPEEAESRAKARGSRRRTHAFSWAATTVRTIIYRWITAILSLLPTLSESLIGKVVT
jgi:hypothetical protein